MKHSKQQCVLVLVAVVWGSLYLLAKRLGGASILDFLILRFAFASLALLPLAWRGKRTIRRNEFAWGMTAGVFLGAVYLCLMAALQFSDSASVGAISALTIACVPLLDFVLTRRDIQPQTGLGICLGVLGVRFFSTAASAANSTGIFLALLGALCYAIYFVVVERIPRSANVINVSFVQMACVMGLCVGLRFIAGTGQSAIETRGSVLLAAAICGVLGNAIGFTAQNWAQRFISSHRAALLLSLESPFAVLFGVLGQESLSIGMMLGCLVMFAGVWLVLSGAGKDTAAPAPQADEESERSSPWA